MRVSTALVVKPPAPVPWDGRASVFLAGTIDDGQGERWQARVEAQLADLNVLVLNPRRDAWDSSWRQDIAHAQFREQVEWELEGLEKADHVLVYFAPGSKSPITLLELGLHARSGKLIVACPPGYWRRGNVQVVGARFGFAVHDSLDAAVAELRRRLGAGTA